MTTRRIESIPDAKRVTDGLRHSGYTPETAIADLIDNSIAASANKVSIKLSKQVDQSFLVWIGDNGCGMNEETLIKAMKYGSDKTLARSGLSVYGLGMKMASTTFSKRFSVVTREKGGIAFTATYDLDEMGEHPWSFTVGEASPGQVNALDYVAGGGSGTVVIWEHADFRVSEQSPRKKKANGPRKNLTEDIGKYLGMVFHRYMDGTVDEKNLLQIKINEEMVSPWNPVHQDYLHPEWVPKEERFEIDVAIDGKFVAIPYILTTYRLNGQNDDVTVPGSFESSRVGMSTQGIYPYRENRILQNPDWLNVLVFHPDTNTLRATLELDSRLDETIRTDVKKSGIQLADEMWENLKNSLSLSKSHLKQALNELKKTNKKKLNTSDIHKGSNKTIALAGPDLAVPGVKRISPTTVEFDTMFGPSIAEISIVNGSLSSDSRIVVVDTLDNGFLWEPRMNGSEQVIYLNKSHPFYLKVYIELRNNALAIQGLDFLLYALANAENLTRTDRVKEQFTQMRQQMSNTLRTLVLDLDDSEEFDFDGDDFVSE
jgi:hypothetical protein